MEFKDRIRLLREESDLTITKLASKFEKSESAVRAWEIGRNKPDADTLIKLAEYFGCTTDYLLGLDDFRDDDDFKSTNDSLELIADLLQLLGKSERDFSLKAIILYLQFWENEQLPPELNSKITFNITAHIFILRQFAVFASSIISLSEHPSISSDQLPVALRIMNESYAKANELENNTKSIINLLLHEPARCLKETLKKQGYDIDSTKNEFNGSLDDLLDLVVELFPENIDSGETDA